MGKPIDMDMIEASLMVRAMDDPRLAMQLMEKSGKWSNDDQHSHHICIPKLTAVQQPVRDSDSQFICLFCGRQAGKTHLMSVLLLEALEEGLDAMYLSPILKQTNACWRYVKDALRGNDQVDINNSSRTVTWKDGSAGRIELQSSHDPDSVRSNRVDLLLIDEFQHQPPGLWDRTVLPLISGGGRVVVAMTPPTSAADTPVKRSNALYSRAKWREWRDSEKWATFRATTYDNMFNDRSTVDGFRQEMRDLTFRQEIMGEDIDVHPEALWTPDMIDDHRVRPEDVPPLVELVIGVDPGTKAGTTGIVAAGRAADDDIYVLGDISRVHASNESWGQSVVSTYHEMGANSVIAEINYGGDWIPGLIRGIDDTVKVRVVTATRGKEVRAEPVSARYERGRVHHVGTFEELEGEMLNWVPGSGESPDRMDALVWAISRLIRKRETTSVLAGNVR